MKYLDNSLLIGWISYALCLDAADYQREMRRLKVGNPAPFLIEGKPATTHFLHLKENKSEPSIAIVCLGDCGERDPIAIATLLVHEAVHIWQEECNGMGEEAPGNEIEAYAIQRISSNLMRSYVEQTRS